MQYFLYLCTIFLCAFMQFIERIEKNVLADPERIILSDEWGEYTHRQLWELSGRVYAWLTKQGIGREDVVLVHLPRGAEAVMVMVGVYRAGAAVSVLEDRGENPWVDYVRGDLSPRLIIDAVALNEIKKTEPMEGYRLPDLHDLAYIAYTTGTTGQNKGVMQEYGTIERYWPEGEYVAGDEYAVESMAIIVTLHTGVPSITMSLANGIRMDIVPHEVFADWERFVARLTEKRIESTYMSPVYLLQYGVPQTPYLKFLTVSFEPTSGLYKEGMPLLFNEYGARETGSTVAWTIIDRPYDITPIGKPVQGIKMTVLDEQDQPVADGELGEICVENHYCRGYRNLPELTQEHFRNELYYTHDLGKRLPDGTYIMYGRMNDALSTKDGLLIALEIEVEARKVLGRPSAYVKIFPTDAEPVICLYTNFPIDFPKAQAALRKVLPAYKVPTDHVQVEQFEYNNGKAIRVHLTNPRV